MAKELHACMQFFCWHTAVISRVVERSQEISPLALLGRNDNGGALGRNDDRWIVEIFGHMNGAALCKKTLVEIKQVIRRAAKKSAQLNNLIVTKFKHTVFKSAVLLLSHK